MEQTVTESDVSPVEGNANPKMNAAASAKVNNFFFMIYPSFLKMGCFCW